MDWGTVASIATAIGVAVAAWQIRLSRKIFQTQFEDSLDQQYRELVRDIPVDALIGDECPSEQSDSVRELVFNYLDLSNEQAYLRRIKRVSKARWKEWNEGIRNNLSKPVFREIWEEVKERAPNEFTELELLEKTGFGDDPAERRQ
ncbi:MAG: hypothetical protein U5R46_11970 [Gammaproteobacteria bacterium]|nr:hypothetical protein [Gammaproteobacteria bacterium]